MITTIEPGRYFHVTGQTQGQIDDDLLAAVKKARAHADQEPWLGILVTRHSPEVYTVALSFLVPYGQTYERDDGSLSMPQPFRGTDVGRHHTERKAVRERRSNGSPVSNQ
jgi:hypothetical protein